MKKILVTLLVFSIVALLILCLVINASADDFSPEGMYVAACCGLTTV